MKSTELFVEQTLTGFLVLSAAAAPFVGLEMVQQVSDEATGGLDIGEAAGAIGAAYLLGVIFDRFADTLLERFNRWNRLLFAIELREKNEGLSPHDPFPEDQLQIEVIHQGGEAWEWMDYLRARIRTARAMAAFVPAVTISLALVAGFPGRVGMAQAVLGIVLAAYVLSFVASRILEKSARRLPKTYELRSEGDCEHARAMMRTLKEPVFWLGVFLFALGVSLIVLAPGDDRVTMAYVLATGGVLGGISGWVWWRTTITFMQFLRDFRTWAREKPREKSDENTKR
ncbi:MAG TPA: hypothetical protein VJ691_01215 [Vicinamibacterales bacterium]|nr:hypothetical protein [Vicinamibacterales bacterium]